MGQMVKKREVPGNTTVGAPQDATEEIGRLVSEGNTSGKIGPNEDGISTYWELKTNSWI
jgi:hypothetical protein